MSLLIKSIFLKIAHMKTEALAVQQVGYMEKGIEAI